MHEEDCRLPSLDWLTKTCQTLPYSCPVQQVKPTMSFINSYSRTASEPTTSSTVDYSSLPQKPPYSYSQLIVQAMKHFGGQKVLLTDIYGYIRERYAWYRMCDPSWQNSIRHNLSLNKQFIKIPRSPGDKGKGSYWRLDFNSEQSKQPKTRKPAVRERKKSDSRKKGKQTNEPLQVNPAILTFLKENSDAVYAQSASSCSSRSSPQIMEIGSEDGHLTKESFTNPVSSEFSAFGEDFPSEYDTSLQFSSCFADTDLITDTALVPEGCYQDADSLRMASKTPISWAPFDNAPHYLSTTLNELQEANQDSEVHPWQDSKLNFTDDSLLFDLEL